jgi:AraC family transcriptional regulator
MILDQRIEISPERKLFGRHAIMSFSAYRVADVWKAFIPSLKDIKNRQNDLLLSMTIYPPEYFNSFNPELQFEKWAAVEVSDFYDQPEACEKFILKSGLYAVFHYKGSSTDYSVFQNILGTWLPSSDFELDERPHFELLGSKYKNNDPESEEEIWIPVRLKTKP